MTPEVVFDTQLVRHLLDPRSPAVRPSLFGRLEATLEAQPLLLTTVTEFEIRRGLLDLQRRAKASDAPEDLRRHVARTTAATERLLLEAEYLGIEANGRRGWALARQLWVDLRHMSPARTMGERDLLIVATTVAHGHSLLTADQRLVELLEGVGTWGDSVVPIENHS